MAFSIRLTVEEKNLQKAMQNYMQYLWEKHSKEHYLRK